MELYKIKELLTVYFEGESTVDDEKILRKYFSGNDVAPELEQYKRLFAYFEYAQKDTSVVKDNLETNTKAEPLRLRYAGLAIAASIALLAGIFIFNPETTNQNDLGTYEDPHIALQKTKEVLQLVSKYMNEGTDDLVYLNEIEKTKEKFIK
ncbi:hypothetical protein [Aquimarina intermedia]|uniref:Uncharacterized protein n=1 Tax=Aquimarina intermedia TaxID=350814 RepID=A0A5S5BXH9_9FLAO|nr:hypothetical protein [Aquimarina intermedia]TYP71714.1 hypothetical protein BD809_108125 [Aquimarina intermedia]